VNRTYTFHGQVNSDLRNQNKIIFDCFLTNVYYTLSTTNDIITIGMNVIE